MNVIETVPVEKCVICPRWDHEKHKMRNQLYCTFGCQEYIDEVANQALKLLNNKEENNENGESRNGKK